jgi:hypothetical protein
MGTHLQWLNTEACRRYVCWARDEVVRMHHREGKDGRRHNTACGKIGGHPGAGRLRCSLLGCIHIQNQVSLQHTGLVTDGTVNQNITVLSTNCALATLAEYAEAAADFKV